MNFSLFNATDEDYNAASNICVLYDYLGYLMGGCLLVVFVLSVLGNGMLVYTVVRFEDIHTVSNLFFLCLGSFNLLFSLTLPFLAVYFLHHWVFGEAACKIFTGAFFTGQTGSLLVLTAMTLDRFCTVVLKGRPLTQPGHRLRCAKVVCIATWVISISTSLRYVVLSESEEFDDEYYCSYDASAELEEGLGYYLHVFFLFLVPLVVIVFCYSCIVGIVFSVPQMRGRQRMLVLLFCHIAAFLVCFVPYNILVYYETVWHASHCDTLYDIGYYISYILARSYCVVNSVFFLVRPSVRKTVLQHVCCVKQDGQPRSSSTNNTVHKNVHTQTLNSHMV